MPGGLEVSVVDCRKGPRARHSSGEDEESSGTPSSREERSTTESLFAEEVREVHFRLGGPNTG